MIKQLATYKYVAAYYTPLNISISWNMKKILHRLRYTNFVLLYIHRKYSTTKFNLRINYVLSKTKLFTEKTSEGIQSYINICIDKKAPRRRIYRNTDFQLDN